AVSHLALRQADEWSGRMDQRIREISQQLVVGRLAGGGNRVAFDGRRKPPAIENREDQGLGAGHYCRNALLPAKRAESPSCCSMRSNWLYLAMRSVRLAEPVLICPAPVATTRSAMNGSSVSPERWDTTDVYPAAAAMAIASSVSVRVPIWFTLMRIELARPSSMPRLKMTGLVTKTSSLTSWILPP